MNSIYIYGLVDPELNKIKYIGATNDLSYRYKTHLEDIVTNKTKKALWIKSLAEKNMKPYLILLETTILENAATCEAKWAENYKDNELYNFFPLTPYTPRESKSVSIRLDKIALQRVKSIAEYKNIKYQTLIKKWVYEKIESFS